LIIVEASCALDVIGRSRPEGALEKLLGKILDVSHHTLCEEDAIEAHEVGAKALDKVLDRMARDWLRVAREAERERRRSSNPVAKRPGKRWKTAEILGLWR
jgi:hypothetical protein